jgi:hypothetical protein
LQLKKDKLHSNCAYNFTLRRYSMGHRPSENFCPLALGIPQAQCDQIDAASAILYPEMLGAMAELITEKLDLA